MSSPRQPNNHFFLRAFQQFLRLPFDHQPRILLRLRAGDGCDPLHKVEDALGRAAFLGQHRLDDPPRLRLREPAFAQEVLTVFVRPRDDLLPRRADAVDEGRGRGLGEASQRWGGLMGKAGGGVFRVPDLDLLEVLDPLEITVLADRAQVEARDAERLGNHLRIPAIEPPEIEVG